MRKMVVAAALALLLPLTGCGRQLSTNAFFGTQSSGGAQSSGGGGGSATNGAVPVDDGGTTTTPVNMGNTVLVFDPSMQAATVQAQLDSIYQTQSTSEFGSARYAYFFKPGQYNLDVQVGYYTTVHGLGQAPDDTTFTGAVRSKAGWNDGSALINFWRGIENLAITPTQDNDTAVWAISQGASFRRIHVKGAATLSDGGYSSGGYIADSVFDNGIDSGTQQQFFLRNSSLGRWTGGTWNMVFVGCQQQPSGTWPNAPYVTVVQTPLVRDKPYLAVDASGNYVVMAPPLKANSQGPSWQSQTNAPRTVTINHFYIAHAATDTAKSINAALAANLNLILTPGIYNLEAAINVTRANTMVLGLGLATLKPSAGTPAMVVANVAGVSISGILFNAGGTKSSSLLIVGNETNNTDFSGNPTTLHDVYCRVGGDGKGLADTCVTVNINNAIIDNMWLWRADHGSNVGWTSNPAMQGLVVNGSHVTAYGLAVEHFQGWQTTWNGDYGQTYFYQSEMPYDPPDQGSWNSSTGNGYASYKVANGVQHHSGHGMGVYCVFNNAVVANNAFETPSAAGVTLNNLVTVWLGVDDSSAINHILNGTGQTVNSGNRKATSAN